MLTFNVSLVLLNLTDGHYDEKFPAALSVLVGGNLQGQPMEELSEGLVK